MPSQVEYLGEYIFDLRRLLKERELKYKRALKVVKAARALLNAPSEAWGNNPCCDFNDELPKRIRSLRRELENYDKATRKKK